MNLLKCILLSLIGYSIVFGQTTYLIENNSFNNEIIFNVENNMEYNLKNLTIIPIEYPPFIDFSEKEIVIDYLEINQSQKCKFLFNCREAIIDDNEYVIKFNFHTNSKNWIEELRVKITLPTEYSLSQNYPNPFNPRTTIVYKIPEDTHVLLKVLSILGSDVVTLVNEKKERGNYSIEFEGNTYGLSSGVYFYVLKTEKYTDIKKMMMLK